MLAFTAALLLVLSSSSHIHLKYCLDGDEAAVTVHFESKDSHSFDEIGDGHNVDETDIEAELSLDTVLAKLAKLSADSMAMLPAEFSAPAASSTQAIIHSELSQIPLQPYPFLPPSRAPPELI
jgi:hypothetical protein